jgi:methyl-accepting chemotaxis protein
MLFSNSNEKEILEIISNIEKFIDAEINSFPKVVIKGRSSNRNILDKLNNLTEKLYKKHQEEFRIYGEIMLIAEKLGNGIICDKIHHMNTSNKKLNYIAKTINNLVDSLNSILGSDTKKILNVLESYSNMNFTKKIDNEDAKIVNTLNEVTDLISMILRENKSNGLTLDESSNILLGNVDKLNISSNEAAASLEETAAALEEITSNIRNNTQNIAKMATYSNSVTKSARDGEKLANQTTVAMEEINVQVNSINEAITVIDQIAFQTNILSLNAAVEAATAGEAGRGFAVVAQEVRNLASRSAEAAREIKNIVGNATSKANQGKEIANYMIEGYKELNENISQTINLIQDIEMSSKEQLSGIEQINDAVNSLDRQTQQNAAIASQTHDVAVLTDEIAKLVVSNANAKEFIGKNEVKAKSKDI